MKIVNFLERPSAMESVHGGEGLCKNSCVMESHEFETPLRFIYYTELPPNASFGVHKHGNDNEVYVVLEGNGTFTMNDETVPVKTGDLLVNKPFASHGLQNGGEGIMRVLVFEVYNKD